MLKEERFLKQKSVRWNVDGVVNLFYRFLLKYQVIEVFHDRVPKFNV